MLPSLLGVGIFVFLPFLDVIRRSFCEAVTGRFSGLENYRMVFENTAFRLAAQNTLRFVGICIPLLLALSSGAALLLYGQIKYRQALKSAFLLPMAIPVASVVLLWKVAFHSQGLLNGLFHSLNLTQVDWMNSSSAFWVLVFSYIWRNLGYDVILWLAGLASIPSSIYEAAKVAGATGIQSFFRITLPLITRNVITLCIPFTLWRLTTFDLVYAMTSGGPGEDTSLIAYRITMEAFTNLNVGYAATLAVMLFIVMALFSWFNIKVMNKMSD